MTFYNFSYNYKLLYYYGYKKLAKLKKCRHYSNWLRDNIYFTIITVPYFLVRDSILVRCYSNGNRFVLTYDDTL